MAKEKNTPAIPSHRSEVMNQAVEVFSQEKYLDNELVKLGREDIKTRLSGIQDILKDIRVEGLQDKSEFEKADDLRKKIVKIRTGLDDAHKKTKAPFKVITDALDAEKRELAALIAPVERIADDKCAIYTNAVEAEESRQKQILIDRTNNRVKQLTAVGAEIDIESLTHMSEDLFIRVLNIATSDYDAKQKEIADAREKEERERLQFEADQRELLMQQDKLKEEAEELSKQKELIALQLASIERVKKITDIEAKCKEYGFIYNRDAEIIEDSGFAVAINIDSSLDTILKSIDDLAEVKSKTIVTKHENSGINQSNKTAEEELRTIYELVEVFVSKLQHIEVSHTKAIKIKGEILHSLTTIGFLEIAE